MWGLAAVLLGPGEGEPAAIGHLGRQIADVEPVLVVEVGVRVDAAPVFAEVVREEVSELLAKGFLFIRETVVHSVLLVKGWPVWGVVSPTTGGRLPGGVLSET